jgi:hypothetical protein
VSDRARDAANVEYGELPELARALRAMGSTRRSSGERQSHFFLSLIDARRRAADATTPAARIAAFDAAELSRALERALDRILTDWPDKRPSARRALRAELTDRVAPYTAALKVLAGSAIGALNAAEGDRLTAWRAWTTQLAVVFDAADRTWIALQSVVDTLPSTPTR